MSEGAQHRPDSTTADKNALIERLVNEAYEEEKEKSVPKEQNPFASQIRENIRFRLMGYGLDEKFIPWDKDVTQVQALERKLVIDPRELQEYFDLKRKTEKSVGDEEAIVRLRKKYEEETGFHAYPLLADTLYRVRREGIVLLAGIEGENGIFHPIAYNFGLDKMPEDDQEFESLSIETLGMEAADKKKINTGTAYMNWRTGVLEKIPADLLRQIGVDVPLPQPGVEDAVSTRRAGIGSALKYLFILIAEWRKKESIWFNIGTISDWYNREEKLRNKPSFEHNTRIFREELEYRNRSYHIIIPGEKGKREPVAKIRWFARRGQLQEAKAKLLEPNSSLIGKGWDPKELEEIVQSQFIPQLQKDRKRGDHI